MKQSPDETRRITEALGGMGAKTAAPPAAAEADETEPAAIGLGALLWGILNCTLWESPKAESQPPAPSPPAQSPPVIPEEDRTTTCFRCGVYIPRPEDRLMNIAGQALCRDCDAAVKEAARGVPAGDAPWVACNRCGFGRANPVGGFKDDYGRPICWDCKLALNEAAAARPTAYEGTIYCIAALAFVGAGCVIFGFSRLATDSPVAGLIAATCVVGGVAWIALAVIVFLLREIAVAVNKTPPGKPPAK